MHPLRGMKSDVAHWIMTGALSLIRDLPHLGVHESTFTHYHSSRAAPGGVPFGCLHAQDAC